LDEKEAITMMLLNKGADPNEQSGEYNSLLYNASIRGQKELVKTLLDKGVDSDAQGKPYGNALHAASAEGHAVVVQLLLDKGADPYAQGGFFSNALEAATWGRHDVVVKMLRERGVSGEHPRFDPELEIQRLNRRTSESSSSGSSRISTFSED
jgi:ankyrin repeat protein